MKRRLVAPSFLAPLVLTVLCFTACRARPPHLEWRHGPLEAALQEASSVDGVVVADVYATWCPPCKAMEKDVWSQEAGPDLVEGQIPWKIDFDTEEGQAFKRRYNVLGLPTVLFLRPDGSEIDRIEGYSGSEGFLEEARRYIAGHSRLEESRAAHERDPDDPAAQLALGHLLLVRGQEREAAQLLTGAVDRGDSETAGKALFLLGRYFTRAAEKPAEAIPYWGRLHREHAESSWGGGALWWWLKSHDEAGTLEAAIETLAGGAMLHRIEDYESAASYLQGVDRLNASERLARAGLEKFPDSEELAALLHEGNGES